MFYSSVYNMPRYNNGVLVFSLRASSKIDRLILSLTTEVGFYGLVEKQEFGGLTTFRVEDILIYPQIVSACTVSTDDSKMVDFFMQNAANIRKLRYHGHSHVNFPVSPSSIDILHREDMISNLGPEDFYIFQILNKQDESSSVIYTEGQWWSIRCHREIDDFLDRSLISILL